MDLDLGRSLASVSMKGFARAILVDRDSSEDSRQKIGKTKQNMILEGLLTHATHNSVLHGFVQGFPRDSIQA